MIYTKKKLLLSIFISSLTLFSSLLLANDYSKIALATELFFSGQTAHSKELFTQLAAEGNGDAHYYLALIAKKEGDSPDIALEYLKHAANEGNSEAMFEIGSMYANGEGVKKNLLKAMDWQRKSESSSYSSFSDIYYVATDGNSTETIDPRTLLESLIREAEIGNIASQYKVAKSYDFGIHGIKDDNKSIEWYQIAAESGHRYSQQLLGYFFCRGIYVARNIKTANAWLTRSNSDAKCK